MSIARFYKLEWKINNSIVKMLTGIESEYALKIKTDGNSGKQTKSGHELRPLRFSYKLVATAGADIKKEIATLRSMRGVVSAFYLNRRRLFAPAFMFTEFQVSNIVLSNDGDFIEANFSLSFVEANVSLGTSNLKVIYNDTDITKDISVVGCEHTMNAEDAPDEVEIKFADNNHLWDDWEPTKNDTIQVVNGIAKTGKMFIQSVKPENGYMTLLGSSVPDSMRKIEKKNNKSWEGVNFMQIATEIASRNGLTAKAQDIENKVFKYIKQENISDLEFLTDRCELEGYSFLVYNGEMVFYSPEKIAEGTPVKTINVPSGGDFKYDDNSSGVYGSCELDNGSVLGTASAGNNIDKNFRKVVKCFIQNKAEANNGAKNVLAKINRNLKTGELKTPIMRDIAAASIAKLKTSVAKTNNGTVFYQKVRQDYVKQTTTHYFRFV